MAHEIATTNGRPAMAYFGETPWHGLGTELNQPATAEEAIEAAGLNYPVDLAEMSTADGTIVPGRKAVVRCDSKQVLGVVGDSYIPIQNAECFSFLDAVVAEGQIKYHTAGALGKGERIWMLAKLPGHIRVQGTDDITEKFLLLTNSFTGTSALRCFYSPIRVCCANTLTMAERRGRGQGISIFHKGDLGAKVREAQKVLGLASRFYDDVQVKVNFLAHYRPTNQQVGEYFQELIPNPIDGNTARAHNTRQRLWELFEHGRGQDISGIRHTGWAAYNAVTEFVDHHRATRANNDRDRASRRLQSQWFGSGARLKATAWHLALSMASQN